MRGIKIFARLLTNQLVRGIISALVDLSITFLKGVMLMDGRFETFTVLIAKISRSIRRIKAEEMAEFGLKGPHVSCLYYLYVFGTLTASELCDRCDEDKAAISRSIEFLENEGYIACESTAQKRYRSPLMLTKKGEAAGKAVSQKIDNIVAAASTGLSENERSTMYAALSVICENLSGMCGTRTK